MLRLFLPVLAFTTLVTGGCKKRATTELDQITGMQSSNLEGDLTQLRSERDRLIEELEQQKVEKAQELSTLTLERDELNTQKSSIEADIVRIEMELQTKQGQIETEKQELSKRLEVSQKALAGINGKLKANTEQITTLLQDIATISNEVKSLKQRIETLNSKIDQLESDLASERVKNEKLSRTISATTDTVASSAGQQTTETAASDSSVINASNSSSTSQTPGSQQPTTTTPTSGKLSTKSWQFFVVNTDSSQSCFEFGSTTSNAALLGLTCVAPAPTRQLFKTEEFSNGMLLIDQRTQMCIRLDAAAAVASAARILLGPCKRGGDLDELWQFTAVNTETGSFKFRSVKTANCLSLGADRHSPPARGHPLPLPGPGLKNARRRGGPRFI